MPYRVDPKNKKCVQVKKSGKWQRKGCTDGPVKKYLSALYANSKDINENEWWEDIGEKLMKFGSIRKYLQEGDIINLTGDIKDSEGGVDVSLNEEPFIVVRNVNEGKMVILRFLNFSKPDDLPRGWHFVANSNNGDVSFRSFTKKYDDELIVTFNDDNRLNENVEDSEWWQDILKNKLKFGTIRKSLKKGDIINLTGDIKYADGEIIITLNEEPFVVLKNTKEGERLRLKFLKPKEELPPNWDNAADDNGEIIFDDSTNEYDNELDVDTVQYGKKLNENTEDSEWYMDIIDNARKDYFLGFDDLQVGDIVELKNYDNKKWEVIEIYTPNSVFTGKPSQKRIKFKAVKNNKYGGNSYLELWKSLVNSEKYFKLIDRKLNENTEDSEWYMDIIYNNPLEFRGKEIMIDVRGFELEDKERLLKTLEPYFNENTNKRYEDDDDDWSPKCLLKKNKNVKTLSLHCGNEETDYIPEAGNTCCLSHTYEEENQTPRELITPLDGRFVLYGHKLNESESNDDELDWVKDILKSGLRGPLPKTPVTLDNWDKYINIKVVRGHDWDYNDSQDNNGESLGEIIGEPYDVDEDNEWWIQVKWDNGHQNNYRVGEEYYDLYFYTPPEYEKLNESDENEINWAKEIVNTISTKPEIIYFNEIKNLLDGTPYDIIIKKNSDTTQNIYLIINVDTNRRIDAWGIKYFNPQTIKEDLIAQSESVEYDFNVYKELLNILEPFFRKYNKLKESKEVFSWDKDFANLIIEGRYDRITGVVVRDVMSYINNVVNEGDFEKDYTVELPDGDYTSDVYSEGDINFNVDLNLFFTHLDGDFELISAVSKFTDDEDYEEDYEDESHTISLNLYLNKTKDKSFFEKIYYKLTEDVRHEIEHFIQTESNLRYGKKSKKPKPKNIEEFGEGDFFGHHTDKAEVEALTQGFYLRAKRERKPLDVVIQEYLDEILEQKKITPKQKTTILKKLLKYAKKNLPKAIYQQK